MAFNNNITWIVNETVASANPVENPSQTPPSGPANTAIYQVFQNTVQNKLDIEYLNTIVDAGVSGSFKNVDIITTSTAYEFPSAYQNFKITVVGGGGGGGSYTQGGGSGEGFNGWDTMILTDIGNIVGGGGFGGLGADTFSGSVNFAIGDGGEGGQGMVTGDFINVPHVLCFGGVGEEGTVITSEHEGFALCSGAGGGASIFGGGARRGESRNFGSGGSGDGRSNFALNSYSVEFGGGGGGGGAAIVYDVTGILSGKSVIILVGAGGASDYAYDGQPGIVIIEY